MNFINIYYLINLNKNCIIYFYRDDDLSIRNKRSKKEDDYYKVDSRSGDRGENGDWDRYKKRSYAHDKHSKHEKPHRDEMLKV